MPNIKYWTAHRIKEVAEEFVKLWKDNREIPVAPVTINEILAQLDPGRHITGFGALRELPALIDELCRREFKAIPPVLGPIGRLVHRNPDGSKASNKPTPKKKAAAKDPLANAVFPTTLPEPEYKGSTRVRWTNDEKMKIHLQLIPLFIADPSHGITTAMIQKAMHKALYEDRWRKFGTVQAVQEIFDAALKEIDGILQRGINPPAPIEKERIVELPYDLAEVLENAPLPRLAAALAYRMTQEQLASYHARGAVKQRPLDGPIR